MKTKEQFADKSQKKGIEESLDLVQDTVTELSESVIIRQNMGDANADKFADMVKQMNSRLEGVENQGQRADILVEEIGKVNKFVENAEKQASKGKFGKIMNVLKSLPQSSLYTWNE